MPNETEYESIYKDFKNGSKKTACEKVDEMRETIVKLQQVKNTYWRRPCLRD